MNTKKLRWGFLSTAQIGRKNWSAVRNTGNATIVAVASRDANRSRQFIEACQTVTPFETAPQAYGSYEELLASKDVDAVYIPLPTGLRKQWVIRAAEAGKHVVCEKPCATGPADLREMLAACQRHKVQFMDGVMFMHGQRLERIKEVLNDGTSVGDLRRINTSFSFCADDSFFAGNIRASSELEPFGCLGDLGWYCIRFALAVQNEEMPTHVTGHILKEIPGKNGISAVPTEFSGQLIFDDGVSSGFYCSFVTHDEQCATISGTKGYLRVSDFVLPFYGNESSFEVNNAAFNLTGFDFNMEAHWRRFGVHEYSNSHSTAQETNLFRNFSERALSGNLNETWPEIALKTQKVMNACLDSAHADSRPVVIRK